MDDVGERLRRNLERVIESSQMTKTQIARYLNVSSAAITNWVKGKNAPDLVKLVELCEMFHLSLDDIYGAEPVTIERDTNKEKLLVLYGELNFTGKMKLVDLADDLVASGKYQPYQQRKQRSLCDEASQS